MIVMPPFRPTTGWRRPVADRQRWRAVCIFGVAVCLAWVGGGPCASQALAATTTLFFTQASATTSLDALKSANLDGSGVATLASDSTQFAQPRGVAVDAANGHVYVADSSTVGAGIVRYNLDGSGRTVVVPPTASALYNGVQIGGGKIYFTQASGTSSLDALKSANLDGSGVTTLASDSANFSQPAGLHLDLANSHLYVADTQGILRFNLDGTGRTVVIAPTASSLYNWVTLSGSKIYFTQGSGTTSLDALKSANLDGSGVTTLASDSAAFGQPGGLRVDADNGHIYVADALATGAGLVRFNLDGSSRTVIIGPTASAIYQDVDLYGPPPPNPPSTPDLVASSDTGTSNTDNITADATPTFTGAGPAGGTIQLLSNLQGAVGSGVANGSGDWSIETSTLSDGTHVITATATTINGTSAASSGLSVTIDTIAPTLSFGAPSASFSHVGGSPVSFVVTYVGANTIALSALHLTVNTTGTAAAATLQVSGSGSTSRTVTISDFTGVGTFGLSIASGTATDVAGNTAGTAGPSSTFDVRGVDFGDAPTAAQSGFSASYPVTLSNNGARHLIPAGGATLYLGVVGPDAEDDGIPHGTAAGDDTTGVDDEDGITLPASFPGGTTVNVSVVVTGDGRLSAWIDWNRDGDGEDAGEQIINDAALAEADNPHVLPIAVPPGVASGTTFARFRYATELSLTPTGQAADGEVEDVAVTLQANGIPVAGNDAMEVSEAGTAVVFVAKLLVNDSDPDGDPLTVSGVGNPSAEGGSVALNDGQITYNPPADFSGQDSFTYTLSDGRGGTAVGTVLVTVRETDTDGNLSARIHAIAGGFAIRFAGIPGETYRVQWADLANGPWTHLEDPVAANTLGRVEVEDTTAPQPNSRFYRMIPAP